MRKVTLAALAAVLCVLVGSPAMAQAEVTKEPTTFFTSAPFWLPEDDLIEIQVRGPKPARQSPGMPYWNAGEREEP